MSAGARSESRSAIPGIARLGLRTTADRRPPRHYGDQRLARLSLPVENRVHVHVGGADGGLQAAV